MFKKFSENLFLHCYCAVVLLAIGFWVRWMEVHVAIILINAVCATLTSIVLLFTGWRFWRYILFIWAISILYFYRYFNPCSFFMVLFAIGTNKKYERPFLFIYAVSVLVCVHLHNDSWEQLLIHLVLCDLCYVGYRKIIQSIKNYYEPLVLTDAERCILNQLAEGKQYKEIEGFSINTVYEKMRNAKQRNKCESNYELRERFKRENPGK